MAVRVGSLPKAVVALLFLVPVLAACQPAPESFYNDPASFPGQPGGVARSTTVGFNGGMVGNAGPQTTVVLYQSTDVNGAPMLVSGSVIVPDTPWTGPGARPLVAIAPGTQGMGDDCAPSKTLATGGNYEILMYEALLDAGYALAVTDYQGLGTPGLHTYTIAAPSGAAVLDVARAAINLPGNGIGPSNPVLLQGYSQGGHAVAKALEIEATYAPELNLIAASVGGVPSDLTVVGNFLNTDGRLFFGFLALTAIGLDATYPELNLDSYLTPDGRQRVQTTVDQCLFGTLLTGLGLTIDELTTRNPLQEPAWQARVAEQRVGTVAPQVPVFVYHGSFDAIIPFELGEGLRDDWCARGATATWKSYEGFEHIGALFVAIPDVVSYLNDRVNGVPAVSTC